MPVTRLTNRVRLTMLRKMTGLVMLGVASLVLGGCVSAQIKPNPIVVLEEPGSGGSRGKAETGELWMENTNLIEEAEFKVEAENIVGKSAAFFTKAGLATCVQAAAYKVPAKKTLICDFEVNAVAGSFTPNLKGAQVETTGKINGKAAPPVFASLEMGP